jgi:hypothetical protein
MSILEYNLFGGIGRYDCDEHVSKNIQKGELESFGYTVMYDGVWDTDACGILAYKKTDKIRKT